MGIYASPVKKINLTEQKQRSRKFLASRQMMHSALDNTRSKRMMLNTSPGKYRDTNITVGKQSLAFDDN